MSKVLLGLLALSLSLSAYATTDAQAQFDTAGIQKKAIVKLINQNDVLIDKVTNLEKRVLELESKQGLCALEQKREVGQANKELNISKEAIATFQKKKETPTLASSKTIYIEPKSPVWFIPSGLSNVRITPTSSSNETQVLKKDEIVKIEKIACKGELVGFWGNVTNGWVYISDSKYGKLIDKNGKEESQNYKLWCK